MSESESERFLEPANRTAPDAATQETRRLADAVRRITHRLALVRPEVDDLARAADAASRFADQLDAMAAERAVGDISEAGLAGRNFVERSPVSGPSNPFAPPLRLHALDEGIEGRVTFGPAYEGPPGHVHGGWVAAAFDELLGFALGNPGYTGTLTVVYRRPTPLNRELSLRAALDRAEGRKRFVRGTCELDGVLLAEAEGIFIEPRSRDDYLNRLRTDG